MKKLLIVFSLTLILVGCTSSPKVDPTICTAPFENGTEVTISLVRSAPDDDQLKSASVEAIITDEEVVPTLTMANSFSKILKGVEITFEGQDLKMSIDFDAFDFDGFVTYLNTTGTDLGLPKDVSSEEDLKTRILQFRSYDYVVGLLENQSSFTCVSN